MLPEKLKNAVYKLAKKLRPVLPYGVLANFGQWLTRYQHEADFEVFDWLTDTHGLVLDVGASRGQSALSILRRTRNMHVFSVEPNRKHRWSLLFIALLHPRRYRFRLVAADNESADKVMHVPGRRASGLSAQGSLDPAEFEKDYVVERLAESGFDASDKSAYRKVPVKAVPLDSFQLAPDMIKLDVEGFEQQALEGLQNTLRKHQPALLIEINNSERWLPFLQSLGYDFYFFDVATKSFKNFNHHGGVLNLFCFHPASKSELSRVLLENVRN